jgi:hypothetical protein
MRFEAPDDVDRMAEIMVYLYDQGVNYFDTAPGYFGPKSELIFGAAIKVLKNRPAPAANPAAKNGQRPFFISTKTFEATEAGVRDQFERQLKRLGLDSLDFYHVWCLKKWSDWEARKANGVLATFRKLKEEGLVRHIVASVHMSSEEISRLVGEGVFEGLTLGFSAANFAYRQAGLRAAHRAGLGVVAMNPLGGGVFWQAPEKFEFLKTRPGDDLVRGGLRFILSYPELTAALVGVRSMADARNAVEAMRGLELLNPQELAAAQDASRGAFAALCTGCNYCKGCPAGIPVSQLMDTANYVEFGDAKSVWGRLNYHWGVNNLPELLDKCTDCGQCEEACTQHLPIRERVSKLRAVWDAAVAEQARKKAEEEAKKAAEDAKNKK